MHIYFMTGWRVNDDITDLVLGELSLQVTVQCVGLGSNLEPLSLSMQAIPIKHEYWSCVS